MGIFVFCFSALFSVLQGVWMPGFALFAFSPALSFFILKKSFLKTLWISLFSGLMIDLISDAPFGIHALSYTLTSFLLYRFRMHFLAESLFHLPLFTSLVSLVLTLILIFFFFLFDRRVPFTGIWAFSDLLIMPAVDGIYALVCFSVPMLFFKKTLRKWKIFWLRRKNLSQSGL